MQANIAILPKLWASFVLGKSISYLRAKLVSIAKPYHLNIQWPSKKSTNRSRYPLTLCLRDYLELNDLSLGVVCRNVGSCTVLINASAVNQLYAGNIVYWNF